MEKSPKKEAFNLLLVLGGSMCCGLLIVISLIFLYGPSGNYVAGKLLIHPDQLQEFSITIDKKKFVFDKIILSYFDKMEKNATISIFPVESYKNLYNLIASDKNIDDKSPRLQEEFNEKNSPTLTIKIKEAGTSFSKNFQELTISDSGFYRIEHPTDPHHPWIYFFHSGLLKNIQSSENK